MGATILLREWNAQKISSSMENTWFSSCLPVFYISVILLPFDLGGGHVPPVWKTLSSNGCLSHGMYSFAANVSGFNWNYNITPVFPLSCTTSLKKKINTRQHGQWTDSKNRGEMSYYYDNWYSKVLIYKQYVSSHTSTSILLVLCVKAILMSLKIGHV